MSLHIWRTDLSRCPVGLRPAFENLIDRLGVYRSRNPAGRDQLEETRDFARLTDWVPFDVFARSNVLGALALFKDCRREWRLSRIVVAAQLKAVSERCSGPTSPSLLTIQYNGNPYQS